ncbi:C-terminal domain of homeodomain 1-domain-containing protein [Lyophyllum atratum]|nr:C-terminal domain of homeodomain 1-domain-containing protein [Lyophyllum atratum]
MNWNVGHPFSSPPMNPSIDRELSLLEDRFLLASAQGVPALAAFHDQWFALLRVQDGARTQNAADETLGQANAVSLRIEVLTDCLTDFRTSVDPIHNDLEGVFANIDIDDRPDVARIQSPQMVPEEIMDHSEVVTSTTHSPCPPYIEPAYQWLLENLHNPYPSKETRISIALESSSDRKCVDAWFIETRKRIGWNKLRKQHFSKRVDIVDAATRFFVREDEKRPVDPTVELEFAGLQKRVRDLYADRFVESTLATKLDVAVKDLTPVTKAQAHEKAQRLRLEARKGEEDALAASSYPSPQRSPGRSSEPVALAPLEEDEDLATTQSEAIAGRKRRSISPDGDKDSSADRPSKRTRLEVTSLPTGLPSPILSPHEPLRRSISPTLALDSTTLPTISRKRRLSDADGHGAPKRPRNFPSGPRLQAVSAPLLMPNVQIGASSMDNWFNAHFGIPNPVVVDELDTSEPLDVQVFSYPMVAADTPLAGGPCDMDNDIPALVADEFSFATESLEISTNTYDINELFLDDDELDTVFSGQNLVNRFQDFSQLPVSDFSTITNFPTIPFMDSFDDHFSNDAPHSLSINPILDINWDLPPFLQTDNLFNSLNNLKAFGQDVIAQDPSLMVGMSGLLADPTLTQESQAEDKADMERRLAAMREEMRQLEQKIAVS